MMKSLVPILKEPDARRRAGALRDSIGWTWGRDAPYGALTLSTLKSKMGDELTITIYAGSRDKKRGVEDAFYVRWVEFGTVKTPKQPFFFVSWRANKKRVIRRINAATRKAGKQAAANERASG